MECQAEHASFIPCRTQHFNDLEDTLGNELLHFAVLAEAFKDEQPNNLSNERFFYKLFIDKERKDTFSNTEIELRTYQVVTVTNCSGERSFLKMKHVKDGMRTWMGLERLNS